MSDKLYWQPAMTLQNPYEPPQETGQCSAREAGSNRFWPTFAITCVLVLVIDAALCPWMYPFSESNESQPLLAWLLVNLPGVPVAFATARRTNGEPLRFIVKSAGIAAIHWGTIAGTMVQLHRKHRGGRMPWKDIGLVFVLNIVVPLVLIYVMSFYEWFDPEDNL